MESPPSDPGCRRSRAALHVESTRLAALCTAARQTVARSRSLFPRYRNRRRPDAQAAVQGTCRQRSVHAT
eukprot:3637688-Pleurochrysis_carterae.AAC.1